MRRLRRVVVTGGCGFIGSHFLRLLLERAPGVHVVNLDKLTYAGNPANVADLAEDERYSFVRADICDSPRMRPLIEGADAVVNIAAETHVDRSILDPADFITTDVVGTAVLLEAAVQGGAGVFLQMSTDEVYGSVVPPARSLESDSPAPSSPYSASKAAAELQCHAFARSFGLPVIVVRGANAYGPNQYPEKFIPLFTTNALEGQPLPLYGDGLQEREWTHVSDMVEGLWVALSEGKEGETYNISAEASRTNIEVARRIVSLCGKDETLIRKVDDRPGHDRRYAIDASRLRALGWRPRVSIDDGLAATVRWYRENEAWWRPLKDGSYRKFYDRQYGRRLTAARGAGR
jgi:dTDP-glucose 4,6-dehydratase